MRSVPWGFAEGLAGRLGSTRGAREGSSGPWPSQHHGARPRSRLAGPCRLTRQDARELLDDLIHRTPLGQRDGIVHLGTAPPAVRAIDRRQRGIDFPEEALQHAQHRPPAGAAHGGLVGHQPGPVALGLGQLAPDLVGQPPYPLAAGQVDTEQGVLAVAAAEIIGEPFQRHGNLQAAASDSLKAGQGIIGLK